MPRSTRRLWTPRRPAWEEYDDLILRTTGLAGFWKLNERSGTVARDSFGSNHGTYVNSPTLGAPGLLADGDTAVTFNGTTQYITIADVPWFDARAPFSSLIWFKPSTVDATSRRLWSKGVTSVFDQYYSTSGTVLQRGTGIPALNISATALTVGVKYLIASTYDGALLSEYVYGHPGTPLLSAGPTADATSGTDNASLLHIGEISSEINRRAAGTLARPSIFNRALSPGEIADLYRAGIGA